MRNLIGNAVAYSEPGTRVAVGGRLAGEMVEITVTDQGQGIPAAEQARIFERFYRVDDARSRATGGTGLGLAIVKHICANHGGDVDVWSEEGRGSTFTIRLPAAADRTAAASASHPPPNPTTRHPTAHRARRTPGMTRILVVEDEISFSDPLSYLLRKEGYEVAVAETGPDALEDFDRAGADLVLLDLMLPGLSGTEVCRAIRQRSNVPVIMLTAKDSEIDKVVGLEIGADDYVTKPYSSRELLARIKAVLRRLAEPEDLLPATIEAGPVRMDVERHIVTVSGEPTPAAAQGVRAARDAAAQHRPGADPDAAHRPGLGQRLRRRHQDPRRPRQAAAGQDRARPGRPAAHRDRARAGLQVRVRLSRPPELRAAEPSCR